MSAAESDWLWVALLGPEMVSAAGSEQVRVALLVTESDRVWVVMLEPESDRV